MTKHETRIDYGRRVARVQDHIADHLDRPLDLTRLAEVAHFSPFHFHRIYRELAGETVAETLRRHRLHRAAGELIRSEAPLPQVARRAGYGSLAAFSRAFAADYGVPPGAYRLRGRLDPPRLPPNPGEPTMYDVTIAPFPGARLLARHHRGDYQEIGRAFDTLMTFAGPRGLIGPQTRYFGVYYDDPAVVKPAELRSEAGLEVGPEVAAEAEVHITAIPAGRCASVLHKGPYAELERPTRSSTGSGCRPPARSRPTGPASRNISTILALCLRPSGSRACTCRWPERRAPRRP